MAVPRTILTEHDDRWLLPFRGLVVTRITVDFAFGLTFGGVGAVQISHTATLGRVNVAASPDRIEMNPEGRDVAAGLALFGVEVVSAVAFKSGTLRIVFGDGHLLSVKPNAHQEAWTATGSDGMLIVSTPGGDLAVWRSRP